MSTLNILFEGWRFIPHGRGLAGQGLALGLVGRPHIRLFHKDLPWVGATELMASGMHMPPAEQQLRDLSAPSSAHPPHVVVRTGWGENAFERVQAPAFVLAPTLQGTTRQVQMGNLRQARALSERGIKLWAPSKWVKDALVEGGVDEGHIVQLRFGVDPHVFRPVSEPMRLFWRRRFGLDGFTFLHVGALGPQSGFAEMVLAFARVARQNPDVRLVIKSLDRLHHGPQALAAALGLLPASDLDMVLDRLIYRGEAISLVEMAGLYQASDAYLGGYGTSFGRPTLEAMACGTPVIRAPGGPSDDFCPSDTTVHAAGECGRPQVESLSHEMVRLMESVDLQQSLRNGGVRWVHQGWTWGHAAEHLLALLPGNQDRPD